jgi:hypothetical protein
MEEKIVGVGEKKGSSLFSVSLSSLSLSYLLSIASLSPIP